MQGALWKWGEQGLFSMFMCLGWWVRPDHRQSEITALSNPIYWDFHQKRSVCSFMNGPAKKKKKKKHSSSLWILRYIHHPSQNSIPNQKMTYKNNIWCLHLANFHTPHSSTWPIKIIFKISKVWPLLTPWPAANWSRSPSSLTWIIPHFYPCPSAIHAQNHNPSYCF